MKSQRQAKILEIISNRNVETQEQLLAELQKEGFRGTQATISRDIKDLRIVKELTSLGTYRYTTSTKEVSGSFSSKLNAIFKECVISVKSAMNLTIVKVIKGTAGMVSGLVDQLALAQVLGCTYGDDTVMVISSDTDDATFVKDKLSSLLD